MIDAFQAVVLALVQGLTEFLPISSSAHLVIPHLLLGWPDQGLAFDVAVHVGTLSAVVFYYREDLLKMTRAWSASLVGGERSEDSVLVWYLALATVPAGLVGFFGADFIAQHLRSLPVIAAATALFGVLLGIADRRVGSNPARTLTLSLALLIGLAQAFAPIPGVSRSGVTITAALLLGMSRQDAARFSFLLSIPIIASAGLLMMVELVGSAGLVDWTAIAIGIVVSGVSAYLCIGWFLRLLDRIGMMPFVYYRLALALLLFVVWLS